MSLFFILIFLCTTVFSQNLVRNPNFEDYYHLPDIIFEYGERYQDSAFICKYWHRPNGTTPDYYHRDAKHEWYMIPCNRVGCHPALSGNAYMGFIPFDLNDATEPFAGEFIEPLIAEKVYKISFMYRFAHLASYYYLDKLEVMISDDIDWFMPGKNMPGYKDLISPELKANVILNEPIINDGEWHMMTGSYTAVGGEKFIKFGIFYQNEKLFKIIDEYLSNNFLIGHNPNKEQAFHRKHRKQLFIHRNQNYFPAANNKEMVSFQLGSNITYHTVGQRTAYYFIDNVCVVVKDE